jgi:CO/xanthine dehydrogenase Mo-binding subunit
MGKSMSEAKIVGSPVLRAEGGDKVRGRTVYTADVELPGMLWAKILRSPYPHARIKASTQSGQA